VLSYEILKSVQYHNNEETDVHVKLWSIFQTLDFVWIGQLCQDLIISCAVHCELKHKVKVELAAFNHRSKLSI